MGKKMSADDKRTTILQLFHQAKRPFTLKEMEKLASKAGVVQNTVKDILKDLTDDNLVDMDKIGSSNWFWSFPSKEIANLQTKVKSFKERKQTLELEIEQLQEREAELIKDRPQTETRKKKLQELESLKAKRAEQETQLKEAKANDPEEARKLQRAVEEAKAAAERWTDNTWSTMDWIRKSFGCSKQEAARQLQIPDDFDYPVFKGKPR